MAKLDQTRPSRVYLLFLDDIYRGRGDNILGFLKLLARRLTVLVAIHFFHIVELLYH